MGFNYLHRNKFWNTLSTEQNMFLALQLKYDHKLMTLQLQNIVIKSDQRLLDVAMIWAVGICTHPNHDRLHS